MSDFTITVKNKKKVTMNDVFVAYEESPQTSLKDV